MPKKTEVELSHPWEGHAVGETVKLDELTARRVVKAGLGLYSTVADATVADGDADQTVTKRSRRRKPSTE